MKSHTGITLYLLLIMGLAAPFAAAQETEFNAKVFGSDTQATDIFGRSVSIYGDTAVIGARGNDTDGSNSGAVYVYDRFNGGLNNWGQLKRLTSPTGPNGWFGQAVDIHRNFIIVGAKRAQRAYIYFRHAGGMNNWGLVKTLAPPVDNGEFGHEVVIYEDYAVVSEIFNTDYERVYIYKRGIGGANNWGLLKTLQNEDPFTAPEDLYGYDIAMDGDVLAVAENWDETPTGVHIYHRDKGGEDNWGLVKHFGFDDDIFAFLIHSVDVDGDVIAAGSREFSTAYILERNRGGPDNWGLATSILWPYPDGFGQSISVHGNSVLIGAFEHGGPLCGCPSSLLEGGASHDVASGAVFRWRRTGPESDPWVLAEELYPADAEAGQRFGVAVDHSYTMKAVVGSYLDQERGNNAGSAYLYSFMQDWGTVKVNLFPKDAVKDGARWRFSFSAEDNWRPDGNAAEGVRGNCFVYFKDVEGYETPGRIKLDVQGGEFIEMDVTYEKDTPPPGRLWVRLLPDKVREMDARWRIVNTDTWYPTDTEISLAPGTYQIQVEPVDGYTKPKRKTVTIESRQKSWLRFHYERK